MSYLHTKTLMLSSALFLFALGLLTTFAPQELLAADHLPPHSIALLAVQAAGGLSLGFAMLNWMAQDILIGGVYSRPVALGNLLHFFAVAMALLKAVAAGQRSPLLLAATLLYAIFAIWFGLVVFTHPLRNKTA